MSEYAITLIIGYSIIVIAIIWALIATRRIDRAVYRRGQ